MKNANELFVVMIQKQIIRTEAEIKKNTDRLQENFLVNLKWVAEPIYKDKKSVQLLTELLSDISNPEVKKSAEEILEHFMNYFTRQLLNETINGGSLMHNATGLMDHEFNREAVRRILPDLKSELEYLRKEEAKG